MSRRVEHNKVTKIWVACRICSKDGCGRVRHAWPEARAAGQVPRGECELLCVVVFPATAVAWHVLQHAIHSISDAAHPHKCRA